MHPPKDPLVRTLLTHRVSIWGRRAYLWLGQTQAYDPSPLLIPALLARFAAAGCSFDAEVQASRQQFLTFLAESTPRLNNSSSLSIPLS